MNSHLFPGLMEMVVPHREYDYKDYYTEEQLKDLRWKVLFLFFSFAINKKHWYNFVCFLFYSKYHMFVVASTIFFFQWFPQVFCQTLCKLYWFELHFYQNEFLMLHIQTFGASIWYLAIWNLISLDVLNTSLF